MPAIASLEDLKAGQKDLRHEVLEVTTCHLCLTTYGKWEMAENGLENICKLWLEERTPEQLKGKGGL